MMTYRNDEPIKKYNPMETVGIDWDEPISTFRIDRFDPRVIDDIVWKMKAAIILGSNGECMWTPPRQLCPMLVNMVPASLEVRESKDWYGYVEFDHTNGQIRSSRAYVDQHDDQYTLQMFLDQAWADKSDETSLIILWHGNMHRAERSLESCGTFLTIAPDVNKKLYRELSSWIKRAPKEPAVIYHNCAHRVLDTLDPEMDTSLRQANCGISAFYVDRKKLTPAHLCQAVELSYLILGVRRKGLDYSVAELFCADCIPKRSTDYAAALFFEPNSSQPAHWRSMIIPSHPASYELYKRAMLISKRRAEAALIVRRYPEGHMEKTSGNPFTVETYIEF